MKMDLALNNLQRLICHKTHQTKPNQTFKTNDEVIFVLGELIFTKGKLID